MHHHHHHGTGQILKWSFYATLLFCVIELFAGIRATSLALVSDAGHNFTDALALALAWIGFYLQSKPADETKTYGYHRAGVLSAFVNALTLVVLSAWIFYESVLRLSLNALGVKQMPGLAASAPDMNAFFKSKTP